MLFDISHLSSVCFSTCHICHVRFCLTLLWPQARATSLTAFTKFGSSQTNRIVYSRIFLFSFFLLVSNKCRLTMIKWICEATRQHLQLPYSESPLSWGAIKALCITNAFDWDRANDRERDNRSFLHALVASN